MYLRRSFCQRQMPPLQCSHPLSSALRHFWCGKGNHLVHQRAQQRFRITANLTPALSSCSSMTIALFWI